MTFRNLSYILFIALVIFASCNNNKIVYNTIEIKEENGDTSSRADQHKGKALYESRCSPCHGEYGVGIGSAFPPIANSDFVKESTQEELASIIENGMIGEIIVNDIIYNGVMPPINLDEEDIKRVVEYIKKLDNE